MTAPGGPDVVQLVGLRARGRHGVLAAETELGQVFVADVALHVDTRPAALSDDLADAVDYAALAHDVTAVLGGEPVALLESLAQRVAEAALARSPRVLAVDVAVHKPAAPVPVPFDDVVVRVHRTRGELLDLGSQRPVTAVVGLGANSGPDPAGALATAVAGLAALPLLEGVEVSRVVQTAPVGGVEQPDYLNAVVRARTTASPRALLAALRSLEVAAGRDRAREVRWGPRPLDADLLAHGRLVAADADLVVPHPRAAERAFVLVPWARLAGDDVLPGAGRVADALVDLLARDPGQAAGVRERPDLDLRPAAAPTAPPGARRAEQGP